MNSDSINIIIRCKYCRKILLKEKELTHIKKEFSQSSNNACSHFFSEEKPEWITNAEQVHGKIACPQCQHKLGQYSWIGIPCSCGQWIVPAFALLKSRTDYLITNE